ncbi:phytanoyl-CoA dioxygenase family protein [Paenibacillus cymbidii]|uniref:phytanoyl-CoA dioxygenase family protein n=1 Tax=Paenibacillus cymbidii TaxID=1639034 RepID=UPI0010808059|nr:phytanoyl-CoA dioxygenase family protein [Paenibacillus cymbidii]
MRLDARAVEQYRRDGFLFLDNLFSPEEVDCMAKALDGGRVAETADTTTDGSGKTVRQSIWFEVGDDVWSAVSTAPKLLHNIRLLMGEEVSFFHGKANLKEARTGGAWEWHQDYGYWYNEGFLYPHMISAYVSIDPSTVQNGCLKVLRGSHRLGRLDHGRVGRQTAIDPLRIAQVEAMYELVECEMSAGSVLIFDCNLLHCSAANHSDFHRRSYISCYSACGNPQVTADGVVYREPCPTGGEDGFARFVGGR